MLGRREASVNRDLDDLQKTHTPFMVKRNCIRGGIPTTLAQETMLRDLQIWHELALNSLRLNSHLDHLISKEEVS